MLPHLRRDSPGVRALLFCLLHLSASNLVADSTVFRDDFSGYSDGSLPESAWEIGSGKFEVRQGRLVATGQGPAVAYSIAAPDLTEQVIEATVIPAKQVDTGGWAAAGVTLYSDGGNFWRLSVVESPTQERYAELVEMHNGVWQAQSEAGTRLATVKDSHPGFRWDNGQAYRFRLALTRSQVVGEIWDMAGDQRGSLRYRLGYDLRQGVSVVRYGRLAVSVVDTEATFDDVSVSSEQIVTPQPRDHQCRYRIAVNNTGDNVAALAASLGAAGFEATVVSDSQVVDNGSFHSGRFDAVLLPDGARFPITAKENLLQFLRGGGDMLVVGGPLFEESVKKTESDWTAMLQKIPVSRTVFDFASEDVSKWQRASNNPQSKTTWEIERSGPSAATAALRTEVGDLTGWDTLATSVDDVFREGDALTVFWAKGDDRTNAVLVEWVEKDGSRWIANVPLTTEWKRYVLSPEDFPYWQDNPSKGRGSAGDRLNLQKVAKFSVGLAQSHASLSTGRHVFWIAGVGSGRLPEGASKPDLTFPSLETFYKYYRLPSLSPKTADLQKAAATGHQTGPIVCPIPRPRGLGFSGSRRDRWIPLAEIRDEQGQWRGTCESLYIYLGVPFRGSVWGYLAGADKPADLTKSAVNLMKRMSAGVFLAKAGAESFSYFSDEKIPVGVQVVNFSPREREVQVELSVVKGKSKAKSDPYTFTEKLRIAPNRSQQSQRTWQPRNLPDGIYRCVTELKEGGKVIDRIEQEFSLMTPSNPSKTEFVRVKDGDFHVPPLPKSQIPNAKSKIQQWSPYGVNYWPSNVAGTDSFDYWLHWLAPQWYDPQIVERDLTTFEQLGFTSLSIQLSNPDHVRQVNDFVFRAARHGILTNLFIGGAHPFYTDENLFTRMIREGRFADNPNIWAYDIAWEHHLGGHSERKSWDRDWEQWVIERYGTIEHAEQNWGFPIPRDANGKVTNPSDDQLRNDGPWLKMAVAYERCADDVISRRYARVIRKIKALDPNHIISARSASQPSWTGWFAYDMLSCGKHFDFSSPEGYGVNPVEGGFSVAYGRYAGNGKPVFWAEFGSSIYPYDTTGEKAAQQAKIHQGFAQMLLDSGANGLASWWSVGGYRVDEKSDYGILAPDGTPRASARELQALAKKVTAPRTVPEPSVWVTIDRDLHAAAYQAVYENHKQSYVEAVKAGKMVGVRTAGTGTTSADCPLTAVGNVDCDGFNPLKHLNAEFNWIRIRNAKGEWQEVEDIGTVEVSRGKPVEAQVSVGNLGEAKWLAKSDTGTV